MKDWILEWGIKGKSFFYHWDYSGHEMNVVSRFTVPPKKAFIINRVLPEMFLETRAFEASRIRQTGYTASEVKRLFKYSI